MTQNDINNSVAIPVNINTKPIKPTDSSDDEMVGLIKNKFSNINSTIENVDLISTLSTPSSVVITEEELTGELPSEYGETRVVAQARDPHWAWIYWEYSSIERKKLEIQLGAFEYAHTELFLRVFNTSLNYSFEIKLPENCDNWYLSLNDSDCDYYVELCIHIPSLGDEVLATSNSIHLPTDKVSDKIAEWVPAKPVKKDEINIEENDLELKEIENSNLKEIIELIEDFDLNKAIGNDEECDSRPIGSSDELLKK
jgi:hypothetical protein